MSDLHIRQDRGDSLIVLLMTGTIINAFIMIGGDGVTNVHDLGQTSRK
jgi:hypothetical protein